MKEKTIMGHEKRKLNNLDKTLFVFNIPNDLFVFLSYHGLEYYYDKKDIHGQYKTLIWVINMILEDVIISQLNPDNEYARDTDQTNTDIEFINDGLPMIDTLAPKDVHILSVIIRNLANNIFGHMLEFGIHANPCVIKDLNRDQVVLEISLSNNTYRERFHPCE